MYTLDLAALEAQEMGGGLSVTFPFSSATGTADTAAVYLVLEPGGALPEHTDSAEEWLVPAIAPHSARNIGDGPARILGLFGASTNVAHFSDELAPGVKTLVVGAEPGVALPVPALAPAVA